jgi:hypothetical protein
VADNQVIGSGTNVDGAGGGEGAGGALALGAVVVLPEILIGLARLLVDTRSVVVTVSNNLSEKLVKVADHHESGEFNPPPLPTDIEPHTAQAFSSKTTGVLRGTVGSVSYSGTGFSLLIGWNNPRIGSNSTNLSLDGSNRSRVLVLKKTGDGDEAARMDFIVMQHPDYSVIKSLKRFGDLRRGLRFLGAPGSPVSLRELVDY